MLQTQCNQVEDNLFARSHMDRTICTGKGRVYWKYERELCAKMLHHKPSGNSNPGFTLDQVHSTSLNKSFDYRVRPPVLSSI